MEIVEDSTADTREHIAQVRLRLATVCRKLAQRGEEHDLSKLGSIEKPIRDKLVPKLRAADYASPEFNSVLADMSAAVTHHYEVNSHHPQHYPNGVDGMCLIDLVEMYCDWAAAVLQYRDGDLATSIERNVERYRIEPQLASILRNTFARHGGLER